MVVHLRKTFEGRGALLIPILLELDMPHITTFFNSYLSDIAFSAAAALKSKCGNKQIKRNSG